MDTSVTLGFDDHIVVNGIEGIVDVFLEDALGMWTETDGLIRIPWLEIDTFTKKGEAIHNQLGRAPLSYYIDYAKEQHNKTL